MGIGRKLACAVESKLLGEVSLELLLFEFPGERREELETGVACCTGSEGNNDTSSPLAITSGAESPLLERLLWPVEGRNGFFLTSAAADLERGRPSFGGRPILGNSYAGTLANGKVPRAASCLLAVNPAGDELEWLMAIPLAANKFLNSELLLRLEFLSSPGGGADRTMELLGRDWLRNEPLFSSECIRRFRTCLTSTGREHGRICTRNS